MKEITLPVCFIYGNYGHITQRFVVGFIHSVHRIEFCIFLKVGILDVALLLP